MAFIIPQEAFSESYDRKIEVNRDGYMESLYVPLESSFTDDLKLYDLFDENDKPKKKELKQIPIELQKLRTKDLYVDNGVNKDKNLRTDFEVTYDSKFRRY